LIAASSLAPFFRFPSGNRFCWSSTTPPQSVAPRESSRLSTPHWHETLLLFAIPQLGPNAPPSFCALLLYAEAGLWRLSHSVPTGLLTYGSPLSFSSVNLKEYSLFPRFEMKPTTIPDLCLCVSATLSLIFLFPPYVPSLLRSHLDASP